ncbi:MAG: prepilin-type N-terminal cleavage/methylation domain-containing protein [Phycisphaerales bacterium]|nr:MAG: prepilin-type N-terminal cleavage/methylation domain-containing protein [Phycisphaerales bacterium]
MRTNREESSKSSVSKVRIRKRSNGHSLLELLVVILMISILAGITTPAVQGRIDKSKWKEANTTAGSIRRSLRTYVAETSIDQAAALVGHDLSEAATQAALGFTASDLEGTYFTASDYTVTSLSNAGFAAITVTGSKANAPAGSYQLATDGAWIKL